MKFSEGCSKLPQVVLAIALISLGACARGDIEPGDRLCPPVVEYGASMQEQAADELVLLPARSTIEELLADYSVLRAQARLCTVKSTTS
ncbi:MAG: hypothetical protein KDJ78_00755 [Rhodobacteraceae bacterium]|nr:hypothetical protein [Acidobacteriota bacterium]MCB1372707.1 hypothetical protein [Paracoccaceae bacterium]MCB1402511.1 hypothetical protein [Paracoccaceae bacterium]MCC0067475.1 hypothetical protein [Rhodovulum sp.]